MNRYLSLLLLFFLLLSVPAVYSQSARTDSLKRVIATASDDAKRAEAFGLLAGELNKLNNFKAADSLARIGMSLASRSRSAKALLACRIALAVSLEARGAVKEAMALYRENASLAAREGVWLNAAEFTGFLVKAFLRYHSNTDSAIHYARQHIAYARKAGSAIQEGVAYGNLGNIYRGVGRYPEALKAFQEAQTRFDREGSAQAQGVNAASMAVVYEMIGETDAADRYYRQAIQRLSSTKGEENNLAITRYNYSVLLEAQRRGHESMEQLKRTLVLTERGSDRGLLSAVYGGLAHHFLKKNELDSARVLLTKARQVAAQSQEPYSIAEADMSWAQLRLKEGQAAEARALAHQCRAAYQSFQEIEGQMRANDVICQADSALGDFQSALKHYKLFIQFRDSMTSDNNSRAIGRLEAKYEADKERERLMARQEVERTQNRWTLGSVAGGLLLALIIAFTLFRSRSKEKRTNAALRQLNEQIQTQKAEIEAQNSEITAQRDQLEATNLKLTELDRMKEELSGMIVHDLKNPLNAVLGMAALPPDSMRLNVIREAGQQMANMVSNLLDVQKYENAALKLNFEHLSAYDLLRDAVQQTAFLAEQRGVGFDLQADPRLEVKGDRDLLHRVLVNLLTNALKYAPNGDTLLLEADWDTERGAVFRVTDHGKGIDPDQLVSIFDKFSQADGGRASGAMRSTGLGLTFCRLTIEAHGGTIAARSEMGRYTTFEFNLPDAKLPSGVGLPNFSPALAAMAEPLPDALRATHASTLERLRQLPAYELTEILNALDELPDASQEIMNWKAGVERAALATDGERLRQLLG